MSNTTISFSRHTVLAVSLLCASGGVGASSVDQLQLMLASDQSVHVEGVGGNCEIQGASTRPDNGARARVAGTEIKVSGDLVDGGDVFAFTPVGGSTVVYIADQDTDNLFELYSGPLAGGTSPVKLNSTLVKGGKVLDFKVSSDGTMVVYRARQESLDGNLYSVPIGGGTPVQLNGPFIGFALVEADYQISRDGTRVYYRSSEENPEFELFSVPISGGARTKLNEPLSPGGDVQLFVQDFFGQHVVYGAGQPLEIFRVAPTGGPSTKLNSDLPPLWGVAGYSAYLDRTIYAAGPAGGPYELFSVPTEGGTAVQLSSANPVGGVSGYGPHSDVVSYIADQDTAGVVEAYSVKADGSGSPVKLNGPLAGGGGVPWTPLIRFWDGIRIVYSADQETQGEQNLYSVPSGGGTSIKLNPELASGGSIANAQVINDLVLYQGDQDTNEIQELYSVPINGGSATKLNLESGACVTDFSANGRGLVIYEGEHDTVGVNEIYLTTMGQVGGVTKLNGVLGSGPVGQFGDVTGPGPGIPGWETSMPYVVYRADADKNEQFELYSVLLDGDADGDGTLDPDDCIAHDAGNWDVPGDATDLLLGHVGGGDGTTSLSWTAPVEAGGSIPVRYDTIRSSRPDDFFFIHGTCIEFDDGTDTTSIDTATPDPGQLYHYLVRPQNDCFRLSAGERSNGQTRVARDCRQ